MVGLENSILIINICGIVFSIIFIFVIFYLFKPKSIKITESKNNTVKNHRLYKKYFKD